jgi:hypothetical protein
LDYYNIKKQILLTEDSYKNKIPEEILIWVPEKISKIDFKKKFTFI